MNDRTTFDRSEPRDPQRDAHHWSTAASTLVVNRTRRVVHQRAAALQAGRNRLRSLYLPMLICAAILVIVVTAVWSVLDQAALSPTGIPDASSQMLVFSLWLLPLSVVVLALVWFHRVREKEDRAR